MEEAYPYLYEGLRRRIRPYKDLVLSCPGPIPKSELRNKRNSARRLRINAPRDPCTCTEYPRASARAETTISPGRQRLKHYPELHSTVPSSLTKYRAERSRGPSCQKAQSPNRATIVRNRRKSAIRGRCQLSPWPKPIGEMLAWHCNHQSTTSVLGKPGSSWLSAHPVECDRK